VGATVKTIVTPGPAANMTLEMSTSPTQRREPVQQRSRRTVTRILDAAAELIDQEGVEAATTRAIADRARVSYPSLYRFFADRDEILDRLLERHLAELDDLDVAAERTWKVASVADLVDRELDLHVAFYTEHPSAARLWIGGRSSPTVVRQVRQRMRVLAGRMRDVLVASELIPADTDIRALQLVVELGDRVLDLAFREGNEPDQTIIELGRSALRAYVEQEFPAPR
jgi:AcrR family transcriptional regulator